MDYLGAPDKPLIRAFGARWLISAVARIMEPGCKVDTCLIFEGKEGIGKSTMFRELVPNPKWFTDSVGDFTNKDTLIALRGKWIIEMGELTALQRNEVETAKAFISRCTDRYRSPYGRLSQDWDRQFVFCGTSNRDDYLQDAGGNRRFWPVPCGRTEEGRIAADRDQLWAEALVLYRAGEKWWLWEPELIQQAENVAAARVVSHPWEDMIAGQAAEKPVGSEITTGFVLSSWVCKDAAYHTNADAQRVGRILTKLGWSRERKRLPNGTQYRFYLKRG
jgi:predicted P-loop ATPase